LGLKGFVVVVVVVVKKLLDDLFGRRGIALMVSVDLDGIITHF